MFVAFRRVSFKHVVMGKEQWRCSPRKMLRLWKLTSAGRRDMLRENGFGFVEFLSFTAFKSEIIIFIAKNFHSSSASVTIRNGVNIKLTEDHIQRIYGLPRGTTLISDYMENPLTDVKTWGANLDIGAAEKVLLSEVEDRLLFEEDDRTWFKLFVLYTYGTLFKPLSSQTVKLDILGIFFRRDAPEFGLFKEFNWCQFLIQITKESGIGKKNYVEADVNMLTVIESLEWYDDNIPDVEAWLAKLHFEREQLQDQLDGARHFEGTQTDVRDEVFEDVDNPNIGGFEDIANIASDTVAGSMEREEEEGREADERVEFICEERAPEVDFIGEETVPVVVPEVEFICEETAPVVVPELSVDAVAGGMETGSEKGGESVEEEGREEATRGVILEEETVHPDEPQAPEVRVEEAVAVSAGQIIREGDVPQAPEVRVEETVAVGAGQNIHEGDVPCSIGEDVTADAGLILGLRVDPVQGEEAINVPASEEVAEEGNNEMLQDGGEDVTVQDVVTAEEVVTGEEVITGEEGAFGEDPVAEEPAGQVDKGAKLKRRQVDVPPELESRPKRTKKSSALVSSPYVATHPKITIKHSKREKERVEKMEEQKAPGRGEKSTTNAAIKKGV
ncbi:hypothetical protein LINGRAHAP2_LOCUS15878 [Linum grandiflorum]